MPEPTIIYDFDPRNLPPEYLQAIGLVVAASSQTESVMQHFIGALLGIDNADTLALATHMTAPLKDHVLRSLVELKTDRADVVDDVDDLLDEVERVLALRNSIVHNSFAIHPETGEVLSYRQKARGSLQIDLIPIPVHEIQETGALVYEAGIKIVEFMIRYGLEARVRTKPLMVPLNRKKKARAERRQSNGVI
jgi:hypothetical protein